MCRLPIYFAYVVPISFSGQSAASEMLIAGLEERGWKCRRIPIYPLNRAVRSSIVAYGRFIFSMALTWMRMFLMLFCKRSILHLNLGQSLASFLRVGPMFLMLKFFRPDHKVVTSLHGSVFMEWRRDDRVAKIFLWYLRNSTAISVLGRRQRDKLIEWGVSRDSIHIVPNTCELNLKSSTEARVSLEQQQPVRLLHLSLLIESKGYPEYLEALEILSAEVLPVAIEAVLCGPMSFTSYCKRFTSEETKEQWIESKISKINSNASSSVKVKWIRGARGAEKAKLFDDCQIFVFPSRFPVEAQPLVLLEAMASGCSIITSDVGEIPSTVNSECALILDEISAPRLASGIRRLIMSPELRSSIGLSGLSRIKEVYTTSKHLDNWEHIFTHIS